MELGSSCRVDANCVAREGCLATISNGSTVPLTSYDFLAINFTHMSQLTEERFEQILTEKLAPLATKEDVRAGFEDIRERLEVRERMTVVEQKLQRIGEALHLNL